MTTIMPRHTRRGTGGLIYRLNHDWRHYVRIRLVVTTIPTTESAGVKHTLWRRHSCDVVNSVISLSSTYANGWIWNKREPHDVVCGNNDSLVIITLFVHTHWWSSTIANGEISYVELRAFALSPFNCGNFSAISYIYSDITSKLIVMWFSLCTYRMV